jgi:hypothetical protein
MSKNNLIIGQKQKLTGLVLAETVPGGGGGGFFFLRIEPVGLLEGCIECLGAGLGLPDTRSLKNKEIYFTKGTKANK